MYVPERTGDVAALSEAARHTAQQQKQNPPAGVGQPRGNGRERGAVVSVLDRAAATPAAVPPRVLLADAFPLSRCQLASFLQQVGLPVLAVASSGDEAEVLARVLRPSVAVVVLGVAGLGWDIPQRVKDAAPGVRVVLLTTVHASQNAQYCAAAYRVGADACVANTALDELAAAIHALGHTDPATNKE